MPSRLLKFKLDGSYKNRNLNKEKVFLCTNTHKIQICSRLPESNHKKKRKAPTHLLWQSVNFAEKQWPFSLFFHGFYFLFSHERNWCWISIEISRWRNVTYFSRVFWKSGKIIQNHLVCESIDGRKKNVYTGGERERDGPKKRTMKRRQKIHVTYICVNWMNEMRQRNSKA